MKNTKQARLIVPSKKMLKKCVSLLKSKKNGVGSKKEVIDILEKEVKEMSKIKKN